MGGGREPAKNHLCFTMKRKLPKGEGKTDGEKNRRRRGDGGEGLENRKRSRKHGDFYRSNNEMFRVKNQPLKTDG